MITLGKLEPTKVDMNPSLFYVERNYCNCHPETCNCRRYKVVTRENGEVFVSVNDKEKANTIAQALDFWYNT